MSNEEAVVKVVLLALAALLIFVATFTQTMHRLPTRRIVGVNLVTVPPATGLMTFVVTEDWLFSIIFSGLFSAIAVPAVALAVKDRARRISGRTN